MVSLNLKIQSDIPVSSYLFKQCKLWVWDFDDTIIDTATYLKKDMTPEAILKRSDTELDIEIPQWQYFQKLTEFLVMNGRYVGIASFGTLEIIQAYMHRIMGYNQHFFTKKNIIAPCMKARDAYRFTLPANKNEYIYTLMRIYRVQDFKRVVLFDDKPSNIADAIAIGIVGVQIATIANGDNPNSNKLLFGPWVMSAFDNKIKTTCGEEIYQNKTFTGIAAKENYTATAYNNAPDTDINFGSGIRAKNNYFQEPYALGVSDNHLYNKLTSGGSSSSSSLSSRSRNMAFGTGIGNRKILMKPEFRWNSYKNAVKNIPKWKNGNYVNVPNLVNTEGYWDENENVCGGGGGGGSMTKYKDKLKNTKNNNKKKYINTVIKDDDENDDNNENDDSENDDSENDENDENKNDMHITENFTSNTSLYDKNNVSYGRDDNNDVLCGCKKFTFNWIILLLILLFILMIFLCM